MAVIIDELEVVMEPPAPPSAAAAPEATAPPPGTPALTAQDVTSIVRHHAERASRVYAG